MAIKIDSLKCVGCGNCVPVCPVGVLSVVDMKVHVEEGCISCGECVDTCHWQAITLEDNPVGKNKITARRTGEFKRGEASLTKNSPSP